MLTYTGISKCGSPSIVIHSSERVRDLQNCLIRGEAEVFDIEGKCSTVFGISNMTNEKGRGTNFNGEPLREATKNQ